MSADMTFVKTDCPECSERILMDVVNGYGHCMYCGAKVEPEGIIRISAPLSASIRIELETDPPYAAEPWFGPVGEAASEAVAGDSDGASAAMAEVLGSLEGQEAKDCAAHSFELQAIDAIASLSDALEPLSYRGGLAPVFESMSGDAECDLQAAVDMCLLQMTMVVQSLRDNDREAAKAVIVTLFNLARDYMPYLRTAADVKNYIGSVSRIVGDAADIAYADSTEDPERKEEATLCSDFLFNLTLLFIRGTKEMTQKETVKVNRAIAAAGIDDALADIDRAFELVPQGDEDAVCDLMMRYADYMIGGPASSRAPKPKAKK